MKKTTCSLKILTILLSMSLVSLSGCNASSKPSSASSESSAGSSGSSSSAAASASGSGEGVSLVWATFKGEWTPTLNDLFKEYMKTHPNVKKITVFSDNSTNFFTDLKTMAASHTLPNVFNMRGDNFGMDWKQYLQDVTDSDAIKNTPEEYTDAFNWSGRVYGAYFNYEVHGNVWNMKNLKKIGYADVPKTKAQFQDVLAKLKAADLPGGLACLGATQLLYNHLGNIPFDLTEDPVKAYNDVVSGKTDVTKDSAWNTWYDYLDTVVANVQKSPLQMDQTTGQMQLFKGQYSWDVEDGTNLATQSKQYSPDFVDDYRIGPYCISDTKSYYPLNCQGYVVSNQGNAATQKAALDLYNWWYTNQTVSETMTKQWSILTTGKTFKPTSDILDPYTLAAYNAIHEKGALFYPIRYFASSKLNTEWGAITQKYLAGAIKRDAALKADGELFRSEGNRQNN